MNGLPAEKNKLHFNSNNPGKPAMEMRSVDTICLNESARKHAWWYNFKYMAAGIAFGIVLVKAEIISWFRIQEMFRLQSFHMYGVIGTAVVIGIISVWLIKKFNIKTIHGERIMFPKKKFNKGQVYGGLLFGFGWALTGACPGPLFAQIGTGAMVVVVVLLSAIAGTWVYGYTREKLPTSRLCLYAALLVHGSAIQAMLIFVWLINRAFYL